MSALATVAGKSLYGKFTAKIDFPIECFILPLLMLILEVLSLSIHYLKYFDHILTNFNKIVRSELYKIVSLLTKNG